MAKFYSTKTYGNDRGLSCCFRQWRASHSHCSTLHGYSIGIKLVFECATLDDKNWCMDFGGLKEFKAWADYMFDHTLIIAEDDPHLEFFKQMALIDTDWTLPKTGLDEMKVDRNNFEPYQRGSLCDLRIVEGVGCEMFAKMCYDKMDELLSNGSMRYPINPTVRIKSVEVFEHGANSAIYEI
jgi:6-pyruvoyltetrahydropterin/6-carboxytetrahydropterin synthase